MSLQLMSVLVAGLVLTGAAMAAKRLILAVLALLMLAVLVWGTGAVTDAARLIAWY